MSERVEIAESPSEKGDPAAVASSDSPPASAALAGLARPAIRPFAALALLITTGIGGGLFAYLRVLRSPLTVAGVRAAGVDLGELDEPALRARVHDLAALLGSAPIVLTLDGQRVRSTRASSGVQLDEESLIDALRAVGRGGDPIADWRERRRARAGNLDVPVTFTVDRPRAVELLAEVKDLLDRAPRDAHLDLDHHAIADEQDGVLVDVYSSLARLDAAMRTGATRVELAGVRLPARVGKSELSGIDISTVVGTWETHYNTNSIDSDRTYNLKVGADHLNGHVLKPHELFSFNEVVGDRTEKEGYRVAPVISAGELIDGLAGGMCQIASTLHAASFFAGLEIVSSTPHSRPSAYIPLGLDSTVVYPSTDLKMRNPFDFPIVLHYQVNQGSVKVELLGKARPYKVVFEREIVKEVAFGHAARRDPTAPRGQKLLLQEGYPGYTAIRRRYVFDAKQVLPRSAGPTEPFAVALEKARLKPLSSTTWAIHYPATEEIVAWGSGPPRMKKKDRPPSHHIPPVPADQKPIGRIVRG